VKWLQQGDAVKADGIAFVDGGGDCCECDGLVVLAVLSLSSLLLLFFDSH
jgi:hypothetical protein